MNFVHSCFVAYFLLVVSLKYTNIVGDKSLTTIICSLHLLNFAKFIVVYKNIGCIFYVIYRILISISILGIPSLVVSRTQCTSNVENVGSYIHFMFLFQSSRIQTIQ